MCLFCFVLFAYLLAGWLALCWLSSACLPVCLFNFLFNRSIVCLFVCLFVSSLWDQTEYTVTESLCNALLEDVVHDVTMIQEAAAPALSAAVGHYRDLASTILQQLVDMYEIKLKVSLRARSHARSAERKTLQSFYSSEFTLWKSCHE